MKNIAHQTGIGIIKLIGGTMLLILVPAGTIFYGQAWIYLAIIASAVLLMTRYLWKNDQDLLARRLKVGVHAESEPRQKKILMAASFIFPLPFILSALDRRYHWSDLSSYQVAGGLLIVILGLYLIFLTFRSNSFASSTVSLAPNQHVISTGPYNYVRHPMYSGLILVFAGTPFALGSMFGILAIIPIIILLMARLEDEEKFLNQHLAGYSKYQELVHARLIPKIW